MIPLYELFIRLRVLIDVQYHVFQGQTVQHNLRTNLEFLRPKLIGKELH